MCAEALSVKELRKEIENENGFAGIRYLHCTADECGRKHDCEG